MRPAARARFVAFSEAFEGKVPWMYLDVKGLVTVAIGNLVDAIGRTGPGEDVLSLPFVNVSAPGQPMATRAEIADEWRRVKVHPTAARQGHRVLERVTKLRLPEHGIERVVLGKLDEMLLVLAERFPDFEAWCCDAQLATISVAWACGPWFRFPRLAAALRARDFRTAARECRMDERGNPGLKPRNAANATLYRNAALVDCMHEDCARHPDLSRACSASRGFDPAVLYWPTGLTDERPTSPAPLEVAPPSSSSEPNGPVSPKRIVDFAIVRPLPTIERPPLAVRVDPDDEP